MRDPDDGVLDAVPGPHQHLEDLAAPGSLVVDDRQDAGADQLLPGASGHLAGAAVDVHDQRAGVGDGDPEGRQVRG